MQLSLSLPPEEKGNCFSTRKMQSRRIIALCGLEGSGKNTAADLLVSHGFTPVSFAKALKEAVSVIFGWPANMLEGATPESRQWREEVDPFWSKALGRPDLTPRKVLQEVGTNVMRDHFDKRIWILSLRRRIESVSGDIVITDCRFPEEAEQIKEWGGQLIRITRKATEPAWLDDYWHVADVFADRGDTSDDAIFCTNCAEFFYKRYCVHPAETSLLAYPIPAHIHNDGTLKELEEKVGKLAHPSAPRRSIAVDFDDVIVPFMAPFLEWYNGFYNKDIRLEDTTTTKLDQLLDCSYERSRDIFDTFASDIATQRKIHSVPPSEACVKVLTKLSEKYRLVLVTAREHRFKDITRRYLMRFLPGVFQEIVLCNSYGASGKTTTKVQVCVEHNCFALIDDSLPYICEVRAEKIRGILFGWYPWNNEYAGERVVSWEKFDEVDDL